jgi:hypothetical protein
MQVRGSKVMNKNDIRDVFKEELYYIYTELST